MTRLGRLIVLLSVAHAALGENVSVRLRVHGEQSRGLAGEGTLRCVPFESGPAKTAEVLVAQQTVTKVDVPAPCSLELQSEAWWHPPAFVQKGQREVELELWPAAVLTGTIAAASEPPAELQLRFRPAENDQTLERRSGNTTCRVAERQFRCVLPAGRHHLRLSSPRRIPQHRWSVPASADEPHDLGAVTLREGASIEGRLTALRSTPIRDWREVSVTAAPAGLDGSESEGSAMSAKAAEHGSFQIAGLAPGEYVVSAALADLSSDEVHVRVLPGAQVELIQPLLLQKPKQLDVTITPPLDPFGERWTVRLTRYVERRGEVVTESQAAEDGKWSGRGLRVGDYDLDVVASGQYSWHDARVSIGEADVHLPVTVSSAHVRGSVTVGEQPVAAATVHLGGRSGRIRHTVTTDGDGRFDTFAPAALASGREWTVEVEAEHPSIHQKLEVTAEVDAGDHVLAIVLPDLRIAGRVVNEDGSPEPHAMINIRNDPDAMLRQVTIGETGEFVVTGLHEGEYQLQASGFMKESQPVAVSLRDDERVPPVELVLQPNGQLAGRVVSAFGPVAGVTLWVHPTDVSYSLVGAARTRADGTFASILPPGTREADVLIAAPGFGLGLFHTRIENRPLTITVDQSNGTLRLVLPAMRDPLFPRAELRHNGARTGPLALLGNWGTTVIRDDADGAELVVPMVDPGEWQLCLPAEAGKPAACQSGFVAPGGELTLRAVPEKKADGSSASGQ
jgi:hypothetical protein